MNWQLPPLIKELDQQLEGLPDVALSWLLIGIAIFAVIVALYGRPVLKAALAAWFIAP